MIDFRLARQQRVDHMAAEPAAEMLPSSPEITATLHDTTGDSHSVGVSRISTWVSSIGVVHSMRKP